ncbi:MAG: hypothetical protein ACLTXL_09260 [Clostridia bacterium]
MERKMHAGEASNGSDRRANEDKFPAASSRIKAAEKWKKMHAGGRRKAGAQRAKGDKIPAGIVERINPAEKQNEKCTPAR